jgi:paraquat-inducible protein B
VTKPSATLVGAFVLGALALIVAGVLFFGAGGFAKARIPLVSFFHGSVAGLRVGAPVTFRGVRVGEVKSIGIRLQSDTGDSIIQVNMELLPGMVIGLRRTVGC